MQKAFSRDIQALDDVFDFLDTFIALHRLNDSVAFTIKFAVEEIFTNMVKYNSEGTNDIAIALQVDGEKATVRLVDFEAIPFDITKAESVNANLPIEKRKPGGLGIHLVKTMVDSVNFDHAENRSTITLTIRLDKGNV